MSKRKRRRRRGRKMSRRRKMRRIRQGSRPHIPGAYVSALVVLVFIIIKILIFYQGGF